MTDLTQRADAYRTVTAAIDWLRVNAADRPDLPALAAHVGYSEAHLQRVFATWAGVSPKRFLQHLAKDRARAALLGGQDVLGASIAAGLSGPGRLHDLLVTCEAASPGEVRSGGAGLTIRWGTAETPLGTALFAETSRGLCRLSFSDDALVSLRAEWPAAELVNDDGAAAALAGRVFGGWKGPAPVHLFVKGTRFQMQVWEALLRVPEGRLTTYGALAKAVGRPSAARAVGQAVGANPIALLIPCHRVIRSDGALGGYRWGETRKRALVAGELARAAG